MKFTLGKNNVFTFCDLFPPPFMINSHQNNEKEREKHYLGFDSYKWE